MDTPTYVIYRIWVSYRAYGADQHNHQRLYNQNGWVMNRYTREELAIHAQQYYEYSLGYCAEVERIQTPSSKLLQRMLEQSTRTRSAWY